MGRPRCSEEPRVTTAIRLPASLREALQDAAARRDVSINFLVTRAVSDFLERLPAPEEQLDGAVKGAAKPGEGQR